MSPVRHEYHRRKQYVCYFWFQCLFIERIPVNTLHSALNFGPECRPRCQCGTVRLLPSVTLTVDTLTLTPNKTLGRLGVKRGEYKEFAKRKIGESGQDPRVSSFCKCVTVSSYLVKPPRPLAGGGGRIRDVETPRDPKKPPVKKGPTRGTQYWDFQ